MLIAAHGGLEAERLLGARSLPVFPNNKLRTSMLEGFVSVDLFLHAHADVSGCS
jgi:hypothetical protein